MLDHPKKPDPTLGINNGHPNVYIVTLLCLLTLFYCAFAHFHCLNSVFFVKSHKKSWDNSEKITWGRGFYAPFTLDEGANTVLLPFKYFEKLQKTC